jgi:hypothetical protein
VPRLKSLTSESAEGSKKEKQGLFDQLIFGFRGKIK